MTWDAGRDDASTHRRAILAAAVSRRTPGRRGVRGARRVRRSALQQVVLLLGDEPLEDAARLEAAHVDVEPHQVAARLLGEIPLLRFEDADVLAEDRRLAVADRRRSAPRRRR